jgi:YVTN family beta-propeller protein
VLARLAIALLAFVSVGAETAAARPGPASLYVTLANGDLAAMPLVINRNNAYSETRSSDLSSAVAGALPRVYVPEHGGDSVSVIDTVTMKVVDHYPAGSNPQHAVPSWDLKTIWITNNSDNKTDNGSMTPIDPLTGKRGKNIPVHDPYNLYFSPDGKSAIVVNEAARRLDFRDPHTFDFQYTIQVRECQGINHADFSMSGTYAIFSCEFGGSVVKIDLVNRKVVGVLKLVTPGDAPKTEATLVSMEMDGKKHKMKMPDKMNGMSRTNMPQDIRMSPDGKVFYVADMIADGVFMVDGETLTQIGFIPTGPGAHGFCVSRDATKLYVANRGSHAMPAGTPGGPGSVSTIDFATNKVIANWPIPGGGSPDMGNVTADGKQVWFSGRFDDTVYAFDTTTGAVTKIPVGHEPHGLTVWPQPGRYSLGHTGNLR